MAQDALVEADIEAGREFLSLLDRIEVPVVGSLWMYSADTSKWKLVIITTDERQGSKALYLKAINAGSSLDLTNVEFQPPESALFKALGSAMRIGGISTIRMRQNMFNGVYVEDALIYRLAA